MQKEFCSKSSPLISVVMPVFNSASYLSEAIESILSQTLGDFELIVVYDKSSDESIEIIRHYQANDPRVKLIYGNNERLTGALNRGIEAAQGMFIARMDADDISLPERFEKQVKLMESVGADICGCHFIVTSQSGAIFNAKVVPLSYSAFAMFLGCTVPFAHGSVMIRSTFMHQHNLSYNKNVGTAEDYELWINFFEKGAVFANVDSFLFKYRESAASLSKTTNKETAKDSKVLRQRYLKRNKTIFIQSVHDLIKSYSELSLDERKFLLISGYIASLYLRIPIFFSILRRSSFSSIGLFVVNWLKGI
jgi:glycosyltransferase involved in cell wall biosynthesis